MKRRTYRAALVNAAGDTVAESTAYAWNSGVRASEALVRELARERGAPYLGQSPTVDGEQRTYRRMWAGDDGHTVWATVRELV